MWRRRATVFFAVFFAAAVFLFFVTVFFAAFLFFAIFASRAAQNLADSQPYAARMYDFDRISNANW
jgi:hypothetical protein